MEELLALLKDGHSRSVDSLAEELNTTRSDILRRLEFLERSGMIHRVLNSGSGCPSVCSSCSGCSGQNKKMCAGCLPDGGFKNMGEMWEVV